MPIYAADSIVRRAGSLQQTHDAAPPVAWMNRALYDRLGLREGEQVRIRQGRGEALVMAAVDDKLPANCIRLAAGHASTAALGAMFGEVSADRVPAREKVAV